MLFQLVISIATILVAIEILKYLFQMHGGGAKL